MCVDSGVRLFSMDRDVRTTALLREAGGLVVRARKSITSGICPAGAGEVRELILLRTLTSVASKQWGHQRTTITSNGG
jgi:hypothetical protein